MPGPFLWDGSGHANNLQVGFLNPDGSYCKNDGPKNYLANPQIETGLSTGWTLGVTGALTNALPTTTPTFGSGASGNLTLSATSTTPLAGTYSLSYASSAATTAGNMVASSAFSVDVEDQVGKVLSFSFSYKATTGTANANWSGTSTSSFGVAIYDVTNSAWVIPTGVFNFIQGIGAGKCTGSFQTTATGTSYRLVIYNANATSGAITMYFDSFFVGPASASSSSSSVVWNGKQTTQAVTANVTDITFSTTNDSSAAWNGTQYVVPVAGSYVATGNIANNGAGSAIAQIYVNGTIYNTSASFSTPQSASQYSSGAVVIPNLKPGDLISFRSTVTGSIISSNAGIFQISSQAGLGAGGVVAARAHIGSAASTTAGNPFNFDSIDLDTSGSITVGATTWNFKAPITGTYYVEASIFSGGTTDILVYKSGSKYAQLFSTISTTPNAGGTLVPLNAGETIFISPGSTATPAATGSATIAQENHVSIFLVQGASSASNSTATVAASYYVSANFAASTTTPINFDSKEFDTTGSLVTPSATVWKFTAPVTGLYSVAAYLVATTATASQLFIYKNGTIYKNFAAGNTNSAIFATAATGIQLNVGEYIDIRPSSSLTFNGGTLSGAGGLTGTIFIQKTG